MNSAVISVPGKAIVVGEHSVVYGHPALAVAVPGAGLRARPSTDWSWTGARAGQERGEQHLGTVLQDLAQRIARTLEERGLNPRPLEGMAIDGGLPGGGLGCSAALCVATTRLMAPELSPKEVSEIANEGEKLFHGSPSGLDAATCAYGQALSFLKGESTPLGPAPVHLIVLANHHSSSTQEVVERVAKLREHAAKKVDAVLADLGELGQLAIHAWQEADLLALADAMNGARGALTELGLDHPSTQALVERALEQGCHAAKFSGAGRGGAVIALAQDKEHATALQSSLAGTPCLDLWHVDGTLP